MQTNLGGLRHEVLQRLLRKHVKSMEILKERLISGENRQQIINELRLKPCIIIIMEYQKLINLLDSIANETPKQKKLKYK